MGGSKEQRTKRSPDWCPAHIVWLRGWMRELGAQATPTSSPVNPTSILRKVGPPRPTLSVSTAENQICAFMATATASFFFLRIIQSPR